MTRRLGLASLIVVVFAFAGTAAGSARPFEPLRIVVSVAWPHASERVKQGTQAIATSVAQPSGVAASQVPRSVSLRRFLVERWLFKRPPPVAL